MRFVIILLILAKSLTSCSPEKSKSSNPETYLDPYLDAIRISASASNPKDSSHRAVIQFNTKELNFGKIHEGDSVYLIFKFVNSGNARLLINRGNSSCGCTKPKWTEGFIMPGDSGEVQVIFNSVGRIGPQEKILSIYSNTYPPLTELKISGQVLP